MDKDLERRNRVHQRGRDYQGGKRRLRVRGDEGSGKGVISCIRWQSVSSMRTKMNQLLLVIGGLW